MILFRMSYQDSNFSEGFLNALEQEIPTADDKPAILCIGSDRHLQDCFGPLTGTMISAIVPEAMVIGTLDQPIHGRNLVKQLAMIEEIALNRTIIALDAAVGKPEDIGIIQLKKGSLVPGKALGKRLPPVGHYSLTGIVDSKIAGSDSKAITSQSLAPVYHMAHTISQILARWLLK